MRRVNKKGVNFALLTKIILHSVEHPFPTDKVYLYSNHCSSRTVAGIARQFHIFPLWVRVASLLERVCFPDQKEFGVYQKCMVLGCISPLIPSSPRWWTLVVSLCLPPMALEPWWDLFVFVSWTKLNQPWTSSSISSMWRNTPGWSRLIWPPIIIISWSSTSQLQTRDGRATMSSSSPWEVPDQVRELKPIFSLTPEHSTRRLKLSNFYSPDLKKRGRSSTSLPMKSWCRLAHVLRGWRVSFLFIVSRANFFDLNFLFIAFCIVHGQEVKGCLKAELQD